MESQTDIGRDIPVVAAAIVRNGRVLGAQRGPGRSLAGYWEFPGGKVKPHETQREALEREIREELLCDIRVGQEICTTRERYEFGTVILSTFLCHVAHGMPTVTEHSRIRWLPPKELTRYQWAPADREAMRLIAHMDLHHVPDPGAAGMMDSND
ncbi:MAG: (deoxy)nucleoside triphosphate pyrophosphohydrolase [Bifidobacterium sp.]|jgi:8-oxo-dGTP diphosphatase